MDFYCVKKFKTEVWCAMNLLLASYSPRRKELLQQLGYRFEQRGFDVDETQLPNESVDDYLARVSSLKADTALASLSAMENTLVLACDACLC